MPPIYYFMLFLYLYLNIITQRINIYEMSSSKNYITRLYTAAALGLLAITKQANAQQYDSLAVKYKNENAVVANYTHKIVIKMEHDKLVATSYVDKKKLLISDVAPGIYNVDYLYHSDFNELTDLQATASLPTTKGGYRKVPCYNFSDVAPSDYVFYDDSRFAVVSYTGLVKNAVTETKYTLEHTDLNLLPSFSLEQNVPLDKACFEVEAPKYVNLSFVLKGIDTGIFKRTVEEKGNTITYRFTASNVPAYKEFGNVPSVWYYFPQVITYITSYKLPNAKKQVDMIANTDDLYKYMYKHVRNLNMKDDTTLDKIVATITKGDVTPEQKAAHIYQWVQHNMHYIAFEKGMEGFVPREASLVLSRKYGDCKDMANILVAMCHIAGLDAYHTWIGTREKPYTYEETPLPLVANHMICALKVNDKWIFMDGTHPLIPFAHNPEGIQGKEAMIAIDEKNYKIITVPEAPATENITYDSTALTFADRKITGTVKQNYKGYEAWNVGMMMMYRKEEEREKAIKALTSRGSNKYIQTKYDVTANETGNKDAAISSDFTLEDYVQQVGKQCFVNMNLKHTFEDKHINTEDRKVASFNDYKQNIKEVVVMDIPKGYKVSHVPAAATGKVDGLWGYSIAYKVDNKNHKITLVKEYHVDTLAVSPQQFAGNNKMVADLKTQYKESVLLTATN